MINEHEVIRQLVRAEVNEAVEPLVIKVAAAELNASNALQAAYRAEASVNTLPQMLNQHFEQMQGTISREFEGVRAEIRGHDAAIRRMVIYERAAAAAAGMLFNRTVWGKVIGLARRMFGAALGVGIVALFVYVVSVMLA